MSAQLFKIINSINSLVAKSVDEKWFSEDIDIGFKVGNRGGTVVNDFSFSVSSIVEYTLNGGTTWIAFNQGVAVAGGQSRYIRITDSTKLNFRSKTAGNLNRIIVGEVGNIN